MYSIFLDDERLPSQIYPHNTEEVMQRYNMMICRSFEEATNLVRQKGCAPDYVSFDNDLGQDCDGNPLPEGNDFAQWLIDQDLDGVYPLPEHFSFFVHSANIVQSKEIKIKLDNFLMFKQRQ